MADGEVAAARPAPRSLGLERALEQLALLGVLTHAAFLPISVAGMQIGLALALAALLGLRLAGRPVWAHSGLDLPCLLFCGAAVASLALGTLGGSPPVGWHEATLWRSLLSPLVVVSAMEVGGARTGRPSTEPRRLALLALTVWACAALVPSVVAWLQFLTGFDPLHALGLRRETVHAVVPVYPEHYAAVGFFRWYQRLAHNLLPPLCVAAAVALHGRVGRRQRALFLVASLGAAAAVVLTLSRAAWVTLLLAGFVVLVLGRSTRRWALPLTLATALAMTLHPGVRVRIAWLVENKGYDINRDREAIWKVCRAVVSDHPLTGVGFGNLPVRSIPYYERLAPEGKLRAWCHDSFLTAWAEGGPLLCAALLAYWLLLLLLFWRSFRRSGEALPRAAALGGLAGVIAMFATSFVHDTLYASEAAYGLGFAVAIAVVLARSQGPAGATGDP